MQDKEETDKSYLAVRGRVCQYEHLGCLDGPGLRSVVFLAGCPIRCLYCHNADMLLPDAGEETTAAAVADETDRYAAYCTGGVTLSGGEPLFQTAFARALIRALHDRGRHVALDTAGTVYDEAALSAADLVILDIKHSDAEGFRRITGGSMDNTLKTLAYVKRIGKPFWIRQVIVEGYTDDPGQIRALKALAAGAEKIELLPYHTMGRKKWKEPYPLGDMKPYPPDKLAALNELLK